MTNDQTLEPCPLCGDPMKTDNAGTFGHTNSNDKCLLARHAWPFSEAYVAAWNTRAAHSGEGRDDQAINALRQIRARFRDLKGDQSPLWCDLANDMDAIAANALIDYRDRTRSGEGRSNGAGEDTVDALTERVARRIAEACSPDENPNRIWRAHVNEAVAAIDELSAPQGEAERLRDALVNCAMGLEGLSAQNAADPLLQDWADALAGQARAALAQPEAGGEHE